MISFAIGAIFSILPGLNCVILVSKRYTPVGEENTFEWMGRYDKIIELLRLSYGYFKSSFIP